MPDVTLLLEAAARGDPKAADELLPLVYNELRELAAARMAAERPDHTLQPTALVGDCNCPARRCGATFASRWPE
jgi:hypothetical protein